MAKRWIPVLLSLSGAALLWAAWPTSPLTFLIFIAFIPLLRLADTVESTGRFYGYIYLSLFIWNVATTWWVGNTTVPVSGLAANLINTTVMSVPLLGYYRVRKRLGTTASYFALIVYWITFEYVHLNWEFSWPWLSLGNAFALYPSWIQWYEYTGVSGGTLWVLLCNISIYQAWQLRKSYWKPATIIIIPLLFSAFIQYTFKAEQGPSAEVVIVQPNIDPYGKFAESNAAAAEQLDKLLQLSKQKTDSQTAYIIWPETALFTNGAWENNLATEGGTQSIHSFLQQYPKAAIISGAVTLKRYAKLDEMPYTARIIDESSSYDVFNSAVQIDTSGIVQVYHKFELVPGVEMIPYARYMFFMKYLALDMGGITGGYGRTAGENVLTSIDKRIKVSPAICYESVYGEYVAEHVRMGANLLFIVTNDGWWGNTEGHRQHMQYARLRAIETRRWVARSANTGISCFIDPMGRVQESLPYWKEGVIRGNVTPGHILTFYVKYGDLISKAATAFCILLIIYSFYLRFRQSKIS